MVRQIPAWVKAAASERGCFPTILRGDPIVLTIAPEDDSQPLVSKTFDIAAYDADLDACWSKTLAEHALHTRRCAAARSAV
jgi:hypothetical protein